MDRLESAEPRSAWALMKSGPFSRLWRAGLISSTGDWVALFATIALANVIAGPTGIVVALVARILPGFFFGAIGGVVADRVNRKRIMITSEVGRAGLVLLMAFVDNLPELFMVSLALEFLTLMFQPAKEATVPSLVNKSELVKANSLSLSAAYGTFSLGAGLFWAISPFASRLTFGGLLPGTPEGLAFAIDSVTFLVSAMVLTTLPSSPAELRPDRRRSGGWLNIMAPLKDLGEGLRFVARHPKVRPIVAGMSMALVGGGMLVALGTEFARKVLGADSGGFAAMLTAFGVGAGSGMVGVTTLALRLRHKDIAFAIALTITGIGLGAASLIHTVAGGMGWLFVMGLGAGASYVLGFSHLHEQVLDPLRGRTFAALFSLMRAGLLLSMALAPSAVVLLGDLPSPLDNGTRVVLFLGGLMILLSGAGVLWTIRRVLLAPERTLEAIRSVEAAELAFRSFRESVAKGGDAAENPDDEAADLGRHEQLEPPTPAEG
ncbi:MAG: MFS transporter [Acidimicrobiia bacterium]